MQSSPEVKTYFEKVDLRKLLENLKAPNIDEVLREIKHFTEREAKKRDQIVLNYFGEEGVRRITKSIVDFLLSPPKLRTNAKILDVGAGSGFFTVKVVKKIRCYLPKASFYAMDITPAMLLALTQKATEITPFLGIAENIAESITHAKKYLKIPSKFDAVFSTLTLHHCQNPETFFRSLKEVLKDCGKAVVIDLCEHSFEEFREEMGDLHLGFNPLLIREKAKIFFSNVRVERMPGIRCECSGRSAELFVAYLT